MLIVEAMSTTSSRENVNVSKAQQKCSDKDQSRNSTANNVHTFFFFFYCSWRITEASRINVKQY